MRFLIKYSLFSALSLGLFFCNSTPEKPMVTQVIREAKEIQRQIKRDPVSVNMVDIQMTIDRLIKSVDELQKYGDYYKGEYEKDHEDASTWRGIKYTFYFICVLAVLAVVGGIALRFSSLSFLKA